MVKTCKKWRGTRRLDQGNHSRLVVDQYSVYI